MYRFVCIIFIILFCLLVNIYDFTKLNERFNNKILYLGEEGRGLKDDSGNVIKYFINLAYPNIKIVNNNEKSNIIVCNYGHSGNSNKPYILWNGESELDDNIKHNNKIIINSVDGYKSDLKIPYCFFAYYEYIYYNTWLKHKHSINITDRQKLFGYCISNGSAYHRNEFIDTLSNKNKYHYALGKYKHPESIVDNVDGGWSDDNLVKKYSEYKFILAAENKLKKGYITEKIINAYSSGTIPIYMGDYDYAKKIFNPKSFISVGDFNSYEDCIDYIIQLSNDKDKLLKMYNEPIFTNKKESEIFRHVNDRNASCNIEIAGKIKELFI